MSAVLTPHPCPWTPAILDVVEPVLVELGLPVHDPFGGTGARLGALCDRLGLPYTGTEIRAELIADPRVKPGDSTGGDTYPSGSFVVVCSPAYTGGISDNYARPGHIRHTYQQASTDVLGYVPEPRANDMGTLGAIRRGSKTAEAEYWRIARACVDHWPARAVVNVDAKTPMVRGGWYPLADRWRDLLEDAGYEIARVVGVRTPRQRKGANGARRADHEVVMQAVRS